MRVVILGTRGFPNVQGGVEKHCEHLSANLVKLGCEVIVFTRAPYVQATVKEYCGVRLVCLPAVKSKHAEALLHTFLGILNAPRFNPDVLHIQAIGPAVFAPLARLFGMKVVVTTHGSNYKHLKWGRLARLFLKVSEYVAVKFAHEIIAISETIAGEIREKYKRNVVVIPNGVYIPQLAAGDSAVKNYDLTKKKYLLAVGRFVPEKGYHDLIEAFSRCRDSEWKLVIAGEADHENEYSRLLKNSAQAAGNVVLTGFLTGEPLRELYSHAGLFVLPSYYEGLPIALLEAMSYGVPCLVSDIPANREVALSEGRYFKPGDIEGLARKIVEFLDKPLTDEDNEKQRKMLSEKYDWNAIAVKTLAVYARVKKSCGPG